jgi:hypothetical protein
LRRRSWTSTSATPRGEINVKGMARVIASMADARLLKEPLPAAERFLELRYLQIAGPSATPAVKALAGLLYVAPIYNRLI